MMRRSRCVVGVPIMKAWVMVGGGLRRYVVLMRDLRVSLAAVVKMPMKRVFWGVGARVVFRWLFMVLMLKGGGCRCGCIGGWDEGGIGCCGWCTL